MNALLSRLKIFPHADQAIASGTLEALKWLAVVSMTIDHINRHLLGSAHPWMQQFGRLAMPIFFFVLAYNLARPEARASGAALRTLQKLLIFAVLSSLPYLELNYAGIGWYPVNVLFSLATGTAIVALLERPSALRQVMAVMLFGVAGALVDFSWEGIGLFVCFWQLARAPRLFWLLAMIALMVLLGVRLNENQWALAALPVIGLAYRLPMQLPRWRNALYYFYPVHLTVIVILKIMVFESA